jgi:hypothetical protein
MQCIEPCVQLGRVMATLAIDLVRFVRSTLLAIGAIGGSRSRPIRERTRSAAAASSCTAAGALGQRDAWTSAAAFSAMT